MKLPQHLHNIIAANGLTIESDNAKTHECCKSARPEPIQRRHSDLPLRLPARFQDADEPSQSKGLLPPRRSSDSFCCRWNSESCDSAPLLKSRASNAALPLTQAIRGASGSTNGLLTTTDILTRSCSEPAESFSAMLSKLDLGELENCE